MKGDQLRDAANAIEDLRARIENVDREDLGAMSATSEQCLCLGLAALNSARQFLKLAATFSEDRK